MIGGILYVNEEYHLHCNRDTKATTQKGVSWDRFYVLENSVGLWDEIKEIMDSRPYVKNIG